MPRHPVVNRRNVAPLVRKPVSVTEDGYARAAALAAELEVSIGSLVDTALRELAGTDPDRVLERMRAHGHLSDDEYAYIRGRRPATTVRPPAARSKGPKASGGAASPRAGRKA